MAKKIQGGEVSKIIELWNVYWQMDSDVIFDFLVDIIMLRIIFPLFFLVFLVLAIWGVIDVIVGIIKSYGKENK